MQPLDVATIHHIQRTVDQAKSFMTVCGKLSRNLQHYYLRRSLQQPAAYMLGSLDRNRRPVGEHHEGGWVVTPNHLIEVIGTTGEPRRHTLPHRSSLITRKADVTPRSDRGNSRQRSKDILGALRSPEHLCHVKRERTKKIEQHRRPVIVG